MSRCGRKDLLNHKLASAKRKGIGIEDSPSIQAVFRVVGLRDGFFLCLESVDVDKGTEDFFFLGLFVFRHVGIDCWLNEEAGSII